MNALRFFGLLLALPLLSLFAAPLPGLPNFPAAKKGRCSFEKIRKPPWSSTAISRIARAGGGELGQGVADFVFEEVLKSHDSNQRGHKDHVPNRAGNLLRSTRPSSSILRHLQRKDRRVTMGSEVGNGGEMHKYVDAVLKTKGKHRPNGSAWRSII